MWPCQIQYLPERVLQFTDEYLPAGITRLDLLLTHDEVVPLPPMGEREIGARKAIGACARSKGETASHTVTRSAVFRWAPWNSVGTLLCPGPLLLLLLLLLLLQ